MEQISFSHIQRKMSAVGCEILISSGGARKYGAHHPLACQGRRPTKRAASSNVANSAPGPPVGSIVRGWTYSNTVRQGFERIKLHMCSVSRFTDTSLPRRTMRSCGCRVARRLLDPRLGGAGTLCASRAGRHGDCRGRVRHQSRLRGRERSGRLKLADCHASSRG